MFWKKKGLIYNAIEHPLTWAKDSALTPTPLLLNPDVIRVYFGARDEFGVSRIRYADLNAHCPTEVLHVSQTPSLDIGEPGRFDDNGVILGDVVRVKDEIYMFYIGFQLVKKVKFFAFTGLAISQDNGLTFSRATQTPILDRADEGFFCRAIHSASYENGIWRIWYSAGNDWKILNDTPYPSYNIKYCESPDLFQLPKAGKTCIQLENNEYRIGRPRVYKNNNSYHMYYTAGTTDNTYLPGFATSNEGLIWERKDSLVGITPSASGWDSIHLCYPSLLTVATDKTYMFYNGNYMGKDGFGYAELSTN